MIVKTKKVYYCEFCKKRALRSVATHEKHCTANPDRECRLCGRKSVKAIIEKYRGSLVRGEEGKVEFDAEEKPIFLNEFTLQDIRNELDYDCPICLLAIVRNVGLNRFYFEGKFKFDYKQELEKWWNEHNEEEAPDPGYGY